MVRFRKRRKGGLRYSYIAISIAFDNDGAGKLFDFGSGVINVLVIRSTAAIAAVPFER